LAHKAYEWLTWVAAFAAMTTKLELAGADQMVIWKPKEPAIYILASQRDGVLYTGVTSALFDRMVAHRNGTFGGFTKRYHVHMLVYYEMHGTMDTAILRETRIKKWQRAWKVRLIHAMNPEWADLFDPQAGVRLGPTDEMRARR
jgi:putative endonuclease